MALLGVLALLAGACVQPAPTPAPAPTPIPAPVPPPTPVPVPTPSPAPALSGTVQVYVTDAPPRDEVTSIMVTVSEVKIHKAAAEQEQEQEQSDSGNQTQEQEEEQQQTQQGEGEWITIDLSENATTFDLLEIIGIEQYLGASEITAGKCTQIRLVVDTIQVALGDGELQDATVPSKELKIVRPFDVIAGETTALVLDFEADKMVTVTRAGKIIVKPVVKLTIKQKGPTGKSQEAKEKETEELEFEGTIETIDGTIWTMTIDGQIKTIDVSGAEIEGEPAVGLKAEVEGTEVDDTILASKVDVEETEENGEQASVEISCDDFMSANHISQELEVPVDGSLTVTLCSNPTTGFQWSESAQIGDQTVIEQIDHEFVGPESEPPPPPGTPGQEVWTFKALEKGTSTISMEYSRPWEGGEKGEWTFTLSVVVK